jgi:hypothetical protein
LEGRKIISEPRRIFKKKQSVILKGVGEPQSKEIVEGGMERNIQEWVIT